VDPGRVDDGQGRFFFYSSLISSSLDLSRSSFIYVLEDFTTTTYDTMLLLTWIIVVSSPTSAVYFLSLVVVTAAVSRREGGNVSPRVVGQVAWPDNATGNCLPIIGAVTGTMQYSTLGNRNTIILSQAELRVYNHTGCPAAIQ
jgi:hypothetical protein